MNNLPIPIGAALQLKDLPTFREWLIADHRDLEIQDFYNCNLLDEDWPLLIQAAKVQLDGYRGRLGIHGPTDGLPLITLDKRVQRLVQDRLKQGLAVCAELEATPMVLLCPQDQNLKERDIPLSPNARNYLKKSLTCAKLVLVETAELAR